MLLYELRGLHEHAARTAAGVEHLAAEQRVASQMVTGELKSIDFIARKLTIIHPPTGKELDCLHSDEAEELLIKRRRDLILVTGRVVLDDAGQAKQLVDVTDIRDLDLTAFELAAVEDSGIRLSASPVLRLEVFSDESQQLLCVEDPALEISGYSPTRETLLQELNEQIVMKTSHGAREIDDNLRARMAKPCRLSGKDFGQLIDCPLDQTAYQAKLVQQGWIDEEEPSG